MDRLLSLFEETTEVGLKEISRWSIQDFKTFAARTEVKLDKDEDI